MYVERIVVVYECRYCDHFDSKNRNNKCTGWCRKWNEYQYYNSGEDCEDFDNHLLWRNNMQKWLIIRYTDWNDTEFEVVATDDTSKLQKLMSENKVGSITVVQIEDVVRYLMRDLPLEGPPRILLEESI